ncbi:MAG TPA: hypothetical protein VF455_00530 [Chryseobacterium sp.]
MYCLIFFHLIYQSRYRGIPLDANNIQLYTGVTFDNWVYVSGMFAQGFPSLFGSTNEFVMEGTYPRFMITAQKKGVATIQIEFDLEQNMILDHHIFLEQQYRGNGWIAFQEHVDRATHLGFDRLECNAFGGIDDANKNDPKKAYNGYITWARFGFTMDPESQKRYERKLTENGQKIMPLHTLLSTDEGRDYWKDKGHSWDGIFSLAPNSPNRNLFNQYKP